MDSESHSDACIIQRFYVAGPCTLVTYCPLLGQQSICLPLCAYRHSSLQHSSTVAFQKSSAFFQTPLRYEEHLLSVSTVPPDNGLLFIFQTSARMATRTQGGCLFSKDDKGPCARALCFSRAQTEWPCVALTRIHYPPHQQTH